MKKRAVPTLKSLKTKLWALCKEYIRKRDKGICQACGAVGLVGANAQTSHLHPSSACGGYLRYDHRNLYLTCFRCNISLSGNIAELYRNVERQKGKRFMERLYEDKKKSIQLDRLFLERKIAEYEKMCSPCG